MTVAKIHGAEFPIRKIFSNDFNFKIPLYQRPYSWTTEQAGELLDDLVSFIGSDGTKGIDDLSPYFLGSIVLIKDESQPDAEVVDGQQRLTAITMLLCSIRDVFEEEGHKDLADGLRYIDWLVERANSSAPTPGALRFAPHPRPWHAEWITLAA